MLAIAVTVIATRGDDTPDGPQTSNATETLARNTNAREAWPTGEDGGSILTDEEQARPQLPTALQNKLTSDCRGMMSTSNGAGEWNRGINPDGSLAELARQPDDFYVRFNVDISEVNREILNYRKGSGPRSTPKGRPPSSRTPPAPPSPKSSTKSETAPSTATRSTTPTPRAVWSLWCTASKTSTQPYLPQPIRPHRITPSSTSLSARTGRGYVNGLGLIASTGPYVGT